MANGASPGSGPYGGPPGPPPPGKRSSVAIFITLFSFPILSYICIVLIILEFEFSLGRTAEILR